MYLPHGYADYILKLGASYYAKYNWLYWYISPIAIDIDYYHMLLRSIILFVLLNIWFKIYTAINYIKGLRRYPVGFG